MAKKPLFFYLERLYMAFTTAAKQEIVTTYQQSKNDTGSPEVQVALLTARIKYLTEHLKKHKHDYHTRYGLTNLVSQRRRLLRYLKGVDIKRYQTLIKQLDVRG
jgi:small subunit ribosomal protein S15